jgi:hypothetical protein
MKLKFALLTCLFAAGLAASIALATPPPGKGNSTTSANGHAGKVVLCHKTHSKKHPWTKITVSKNAAKAYEKHGDVPAAADGSCPKAPETTTTTTATTTATTG